ncbi:MAG: S9 family peptidase [Thermomicrobiales bacterium]
MPSQKTNHSQDDIAQLARRFFSMSSLGSPVWIDNDTLAVLDDRTGVPQVSTLNLDNGTLTARTNFPERVLSLLGKPGADHLVFGMDTGGNERQQLWRLPTAEGDPVRLTTDDNAMHEPGAIATDGQIILYRSNERDSAKFDIVASSIEDFDPSIWLEADGMPYPIDASSELGLALIGRLNTNLDASLLLLYPETGIVVDLMPHEGEASLNGAWLDADGSFVWVVTNVDREFHRVIQIDLASYERREFFSAEWDVEQLSVSPDRGYVALGINEDGMSQVSILDTRNADIVASFAVEPGVVDRLAWSPDSSRIAFGLSTPARAGRIFIGALNGNVETFDAEESDDSENLPTPEVIRYPTFDGRVVPAFWFTPPGDGPFPVVIEVHGGPESQRRANFMPQTQLWLSLGVAVLATNVRGSTGYGKEYCHLDDVELRLDSVRDLAEASTWLRARGDVDAERITVMGGSYGGFMTLAAITFHPELWRAAVDIVGICNWVSFLERTGPWRVKHRAYEYGNLEDNRDFLESVSPLTHVDRIRTPLFVIHGRNDPRVPLLEAEQMVAALEARNLPVELMVFDDEGHGLSKRENRIAGYAAAAGFVLEQLAE